MDENIDNYTIDDLYELFQLDSDLVTEESNDYMVDTIKKTINQTSNMYAQKRPEYAHVFAQMRNRLINDVEQTYAEHVYGDEDEDEDEDEDQTEKWTRHEALPQSNKVQHDKTTDRVQKIDVYKNNHVPMKQEQLGVNNTFNVPISQDTLNPNLKNTTSRLINIDSQFRQDLLHTTSTNYTCNLSDQLSKVLSLRLYSVQIPRTWYTMDTIYDNNVFSVVNNGNTFTITVEPGNYSPNELCSQINTIIQTMGFTYPTSPVPNIATYNANNGKCTLQLHNWIDPMGGPINGIANGSDGLDGDPRYVFFDMSLENSSCRPSVRSISDTLGWMLGFRTVSVPIYISGNTPQAVVNLTGTKYFIIVLDDYNQNHINNGLVSITSHSYNVELPSYYTSSQPYLCTEPTTATRTQSIQTQSKFGLTAFPQLVPSAPRTLTQSQLYTVNEILKSKSMNTSFRATAPTSFDTFALIPIKYGGLTTGDMYVDFSGSLQDNIRIYFGPVDISRIRIQLLDDKGRVVDLHGADWCITLISDNLYQY